MNYSADASAFERGAWALCIGIDVAIFTFGLLALCLITLHIIGDLWINRKSKQT